MIETLVFICVVGWIVISITVLLDGRKKGKTNCRCCKECKTCKYVIDELKNKNG